MADPSLGRFIRLNHDELVLRCRARAATIANWPSTEAEVSRGIPLFLHQLIDELDSDASQTVEIRQTATEHGQALYDQGFTVSQVVHDYGNVCQSVTDLAMESGAPITTDDFRTLNRCLDDAIAGAVTEFTRQQGLKNNTQSHELQSLIGSAITAFEVLQTGSVGVSGRTGTLVHRTLLDMRTRLRGPRPESLPAPDATSPGHEGTTTRNASTLSTLSINGEAIEQPGTPAAFEVLLAASARRVRRIP